ncbi:MAG TPA: hypothetical protein VK595_00115, partial [Vicinamibacterales bacterium]|nr:hypothetical protein [Vicinamibacterales bacterium]
LASGLNGLLFPTRIDDGVRGTAQVISATGYYGNAVYQNCHLELVVEAPGVPATAVSLDALVHRLHWPQAGAVLPVLVEKQNPQEVQILWDETVDSRTSGRAEPERVAAERRGERSTPLQAAGPAFVGNPLGLGAGTTVKVVGDVSKITREQRQKLKAMGVDLDALLGDQP